MRMFRDGKAYLTGGSGQENLQSRKYSGKRIAGVMTLALAVSLFTFAPMWRAQAQAAGNDAVAPAQASDQAGNAAPDQAPPPQPNVVRLSDVEGTVQILRDGQVQFSHAVMNMPLMPGSRIDTGADGRAEIEFADGSVARITPNSSLDISQLEITTDGTIQTAVEQLSGLIYYELRSDPKTPFKVTFGARTVVPTVNSTFRINLGATPQDLAVLDGKVQVQGASDSYTAKVPQGKTIQFQPAGSTQYTIANWIAPNGFDDWNNQRDQEAAKEAENQTPARVQQGGGSIMDSGIGWSDLDNAGGWYPLPGYGMVWQPYGVGADFDPYGNGMWADFGGGFGYSWVSGYPWGWLPFNCGAWSYIGSFGWGWTPGFYGCGGFGFGYGYGRHGYWRNHRYPHTNIHGAPSGYRAPVPPAIVKGQTPQRIVRVGNPSGASRQMANTHTTHGSARSSDHGGRQVMFNGQKIAPLHSMMAGVHVPSRNAALYNNYPAHAFQGNVRSAMLDHNGSMSHGSISHGSNGAMLRGSNGAMSHHFVSTNRGAAFNGTRRGSFGNHSFGNHSFGSANRPGFGQHTSFGSHGSFGGSHSTFTGGGARSGGGFHSGGFHGSGGSVGHSGGFSSGGSGGFHGGGSMGGGGFHGGGGGGHYGR